MHPHSSWANVSACACDLLQGKGGSTALNASMQGISFEAMQLFLLYMYTSDPGSLINSWSVEQILTVAPLADRFQVLPLIDACDCALRGAQALEMHRHKHACDINKQ